MTLDNAIMYFELVVLAIALITYAVLKIRGLI